MNTSDDKSYKLEFVISAKKEWDKLNPSIRKQFAHKLKERLNRPEVIGDKLSSLPRCYKIKLRASGYRLVYEVLDDALLVLVLAVGKRERNQVYIQAAKRFKS